jgi:cardiolipin synthase
MNPKNFPALAFIALIALCGCSTLPTIDTDKDSRSSASHLEGASGRLSAQQSKAILARLQSGGKETSIFDRHLALEEGVVGTALMVGNKVVLLQNGPATYKAMFDAIAGAKDHINMETYIIEDDEIGRKFADALIRKQSQGVQVTLIYDSVGSSGTAKEFFKRLTDSGITVLEFHPINPLTAKRGWQVYQRDHRKLLIVDGQTAFMGGVNISGVYSSGSSGSTPKAGAPGGGKPWRDTDLQVQGPVVADFQKLFLATWEKQKGEAMAPRKFFPAATTRGGEVVRAIGSSPNDPYSLIYATLISAIDSAETSVHLTNAYFVPDPQLLSSLKEAAERGVDVRLILPSATDSWMVFNAGRSHYANLLKSGVKIHERRGALLHSKTAIVDGVWSTVGSTNLDWRSFLFNEEVNAVVLGQEFAAQMQTMFDEDIAVSDAITLESWNDRPLQNRVKELAARMWAYAL